MFQPSLPTPAVTLPNLSVTLYSVIDILTVSWENTIMDIEKVHIFGEFSLTMGPHQVSNHIACRNPNQKMHLMAMTKITLDLYYLKLLFLRGLNLFSCFYIHGQIKWYK